MRRYLPLPNRCTLRFRANAVHPTIPDPEQGSCLPLGKTGCHFGRCVFHEVMVMLAEYGCNVQHRCHGSVCLTASFGSLYGQAKDHHDKCLNWYQQYCMPFPLFIGEDDLLKCSSAYVAAPVLFAFHAWQYIPIHKPACVHKRTCLFWPAYASCCLQAASAAACATFTAASSFSRSSSLAARSEEVSRSSRSRSACRSELHHAFMHTSHNPFRD